MAIQLGELVGWAGTTGVVRWFDSVDVIIENEQGYTTKVPQSELTDPVPEVKTLSELIAEYKGSPEGLGAYLEANGHKVGA